MATSYLRRLERLEDAPVKSAQEGMLITILLVGATDGRPTPGEEPIEAQCEGATLKRDPGEGKEAFLKRIEDAFTPPPGLVRQAIVHQGKPPQI